MKMLGRLLILLALLLGAGVYTGLIPLQLPGRAAFEDARRPPLYRWQDAKGQPVYGSQPPAGVKAEVVQDQGRMSTLPATKIPEPPKKELPPGVTIQQLATERAINQATGGK
jgi:hypothetical protein